VGEIEGILFPKRSREVLFGVNPEANHIDIRVTEGEASCCGVNLAFAGLGVGFMGLGLGLGLV
jgi:hypothetical protein